MISKVIQRFCSEDISLIENYSVNDFLKMNNEDILKENNGKKFIALCNPPYGDQSNGGMFLDMQFVEKLLKITDKFVVIHPANRWASNTKVGKNNAESKHLKELEIIDGNKAFDISTRWHYAGIYTYDMTKEYDEVSVNFEDKKTNNYPYDDFNLRQKLLKDYKYPDGIIEIIDKTKPLYNELKEKYKTMVNDGHGFIYEENRLQRGKKQFGITKTDNKSLHRVKEYLKEGKYKYCLYKGSFNHDYDEVQEWKGQDPDKLFKGQACWLTNKENVKNNIKYWMECPLFDVWRKYYFPGGAAIMCTYGLIPALDFEMNEDKFKKYVDSLNKFDKKEIEELKNYNVHNADKL